MNDFDALADRLHELGRRAPVPAVDPLLDIRRGRAALRRRRTRAAAGVTTTLMALGAVAAIVPAVPWSESGAETGVGATLHPADSPSVAMPPTPTSDPENLCPSGRGSATEPGLDATAAMKSTRRRVVAEPWRDPAVAPALASYRRAAAAVLDPAGRHLDRDVTNIQVGCDPSGELTHLGTKLGWASGDALGVVQLEVSREPADELQVVLAHGGWAPADRQLPAGVTTARVADDDGGRAVVVERPDGLAVAVDVAGVWGNNAAPGSPAAGDLPGVDELLALAASSLLTLPER